MLNYKKKFLEAKTENDDFLSIIFVHYAPNEDRRKLAFSSFKSLLDTTKNYPCEIIVVTNGNEDDFPEATIQIKNKDNLFFPMARNQGINISSGKYICVVDNDLLYDDGWIEKSVELLKKVEGKKLLVTPLYAIPSHRKYSYERDGFLVNPFAGSNCWLMNREDWNEIGGFEQHIISGTLWCRRYIRMGYSVALVTGDHFKGIVHDQGQGRTPYAGYQKRGYVNGVDARDVKFYKTLTDGTRVNIC